MDKRRLRLITDDAPEAAEVLALDAATHSALSRAAAIAAAGSASVLAQMVRAPVPASELEVRILPAADAADLPLLKATAAVRAHREIVGDLSGDLLMGQSNEIAAWLGPNLSSLGDVDPEWTRQRLCDLAGISLAAFGLAFGRATGLRLEPELSDEDGLLGPDGALLRSVAEHRLAVVMESRARDQRAIGDFYLFTSADDLTRLVSAVGGSL